MLEQILELMSGSTVLAMAMVIALALALFLASGRTLASAREEMLARLRDITMRVSNVQTASAGLAADVQKFDAGLQTRYESLKGSISRLSGVLGDVRREAHFVEKQVCRLETKTAMATHKVDAVAQQVKVEVNELKSIEDKIVSNISKIKTYGQQIEALEHEVRSLERKRLHYHINSSIGLVTNTSRQLSQIEREVQALKGLENSHGVDLKRIDSEIKNSIAKVNHNALQINHLEREVHVLENHDDLKNGHSGSKNGTYQARLKAEAELNSAYRKIEKLMDETISVEIGCQVLYTSERQGLIVAQDIEEHYRKLMELAAYIFNDVRKYFAPCTIQAMELEAEQLEWSRGELFTNAGNPETARAYHQQVKAYLIKLKESITKSRQSIAA